MPILLYIFEKSSGIDLNSPIIYWYFLLIEIKLSKERKMNLGKTIFSQIMDFLPHANDNFGVELQETVYALDPSTIDLCLSVFPWATGDVGWKFTFTAAATFVQLFLYSWECP